ncbi:amino acid ABC transporter permease [Sinisalibacter aestuarii]|uniref:Amino acid ABC transporter permease n=1 Tax=Sinisalibacter aestuarii TaxID=2949426 RepID=A0ABQ5LW26_9RHOB|nr:amino acid ABC transporter permease [Sinisalibacter aestuarii]GKY89187.1 amino acid ABC transporter permease [Sinisalibacter aestuarii]
MNDLSFVRTEMLPERDPPPSTTGVIGWLRKNMFDGVWNTLLTIASIGLIVWVLGHILPWIWSPTWNAGSLDQCREIVGASGKASGACWGVIHERWPQMLYGFYPAELRLRPTLAFFLLFIALIPVLFNMISRRMNWFLLALVLFVATFFTASSALMIVVQIVLAAAVLYIGYTLVANSGSDRAEQIAAGARRLPNPLIFTALYVFLMPWLLWGGTIWTPVGAALGFVIGWLVFRLLAPVLGTLTAIILAFAAPVLWWLLLNGLFASAMHAILPFGLEPVESRQFGGLLLSVTIGVTAIAVSLPMGIVLALGRQSDLVIVKSLSVIFIEFIRGVPLITLLFVASVLLNIFLPPGTDFDIILRVIIMATVFASAYMAEVIRGGLAALPKGQYEAADALGLDYWKAQRLIIMPQALKISIPGIVSTFIGLFKDTTLVSIIGLLDPVGLSNSIRADTNWNGIVWELYGFIALLFFIFTFSMSRYSMYLERRLRTDHR